MLNIPVKLVDAVDPNYGQKVKKDSKAVKESMVAAENWRQYVRCRDNGHTEYVKNAKLYNDFYKGDQWSEEDLKKLNESGRPALTINKILSTINTVLGNQRSRRADFQFRPAKDATQAGAVALTKLAMAEAEANNLDHIESQVFENGIIEDRGYFDMRMNFDETMQGTVEISASDNRQVLLDPDDKHYDPVKWRQVIVTEFLSLEEIKAEYGEDKAKELEYLASNGGFYLRDSFEWDTPTFSGDEGQMQTPLEAGDDKEIKSVRVIDRQHHRHTKVYSLVDVETGMLKPLPMDITKKEATLLAKKFGAPLISRTEKKVRHTVSADHVLLHDDWSIYRTFTIIPYFPLYRPGAPFGMVKNLISPQEQLNKLSSQELHIVNGTANSGWQVEKGSLSNMSVDELVERGSQSGVVLEYKPSKRPPEKIKPNTIPTGLDRISQKAAFNIKEISGVNDSMLGLEGAEVSGVALESKKNSGLMQMHVPMDNLALTRKMLGRKMLELFQDFYTEERIIYITNEHEPEAPSEPFVINQVKEDGTVDNLINYGRYSLTVSTQPARDSFNDSQFAEAINLRTAGIAIPDYRVVQYSNLAKKHEVAEETRQMQGLTPPSEEEMAMANFQQELMIKQSVAALQKLQAEINQIQANAAMLQAKANDISQSDQMELEKLESELSTKQLEFDLRRQLAVISATNKMDQTQLNNQGQLERQLFTNLSQQKDTQHASN